MNNEEEYIVVTHKTYLAFKELTRLKYFRLPSEDFGTLLRHRYLKYTKKNQPAPFFCIGTLKDETKTKEKRNKARLFCNGSKASLIEARKYVGTLFEQITKHTGEGDIYIGLNPHGIAWRMAFLKLKRFGRLRSIADDIAAWDLHMGVMFVGFLIDHMIKMGIKEAVCNAARLVFMATLCPFIIIGGVIYRLLVMPSGSYLTAMLNSMYNSWMIRVLWLVRCREEGEELVFDVFVALMIFGDDNEQTVNPELPTAFWNGKVIAELRLKHFGMTTTSIFKDGREIPEFMPLVVDSWSDEGAQFIKRQFREENGVIFPILDIDSIHSMLSWVRPNKLRPIDICVKDNVETALRELCYYSRETFDKYFNYFSKYYVVKKWGVIPVNFNAQRAHYFQS